MRLRTIMLAAALAALAGASAKADCTCRAGGQDYELGTSACLQTPTGARIAVCDMVLNNTSWRISSTPCVSADSSSRQDGEGPQPRPRTATAHRH